MAWRFSGRIALVGCIAAVFASGCGSLSQHSGGARIEKKGRGGPAKRITRKPISRRGQVLSGPQQVGVFTGTFNSRTGQLTIEPESRTRATQYGPRHAITLTGTATALPNGILRGTVTLASTNPVELVDCRAVLLSVSTTGVVAHNPDGTTDLSGTPRPYWEYGTIRAGQEPLSRDWEFQNPGGVNFTFRVAIFANTWTVASADANNVSSCWFVNATTGWAVGSKGKILHTQDGGATWTVQNAGTGADLKDVCFISATHGWAVGTTGTILQTTDGGTTWRHREAIADDGSSLPVTRTLNAVSFVSATTGVAVGDNLTIVRTTDGGNTWRQVSSTAPTAPLYDVDFGDATTGWAVGAAATVLKTTDAGATWTPQSVPSSQRPLPLLGISHILQSVHFNDAQRGWAVGAFGWVLVTTNGGATWTKKRPTQSAEQTNLNGVFFASNTTGWAIQVDGVVLGTTDGGNTWAPLPSAPTAGILNGIAGLPGNTNRLWVVGQNGYTGYTTNGGENWLRPGQAAGTTWATAGTLNALWFHNATRGWAVGPGGSVLRTLDGGTSWRFAGSLDTFGSDLEDVHFVNATDGWAVGSRGRIVRTRDGGQSWTALYWSGLDVIAEGKTPVSLYGVRFLDSQRGWIVGQNSTILRTSDGGDTWETLFSPATAAFQKIAWLNEQRGWIVGNDGTIIGTSDGGESWQLLFSGTSEDLNHIAAVPTGPSGVTVWVVGGRGTLLKSTNGVNFEAVSLEIPQQTLYSVAFLPNGQHGWIAGNDGLVLRTRDGGATWAMMDTGVGGVLLRTIFPVSADEAWLGGQGGTLRVFR